MSSSADTTRTGPAADGDAAGTDSVAAAALRAELLGMLERDQAARKKLMASVGEGGGEPEMETVMAVMQIDQKNTARLKEVVREHGWPDRALVGEEGRHATFLLVQHADRDPALQRRYLEHLRSAYEAGQAPGDELALLTDRVRRNAGEPQLYGTQVNVEEGALVVQETEDPAGLDARRAKMGLPPMEEYLEVMREQVGLAP